MPTPDDPYPEHWYEVVEEETLRQGDIFRSLPVYWLPSDIPETEPGADLTGTDLRATGSWGDWIVMTASCDLDQRRCDHALVANVLEATASNLGAKSEKEREQYEEVARMGINPALFLLPEHPGVEPSFPRSVAYFRTQSLLPLEYLLRACDGPRLRLRHPFRELFGNWVGQRFSSVGPEDYAQIPRERGVKVFPAHWVRAANAAEAAAGGEGDGD